MFLRRAHVLACVAVLGATAVVPSSVSSLAGLLPGPPAAHNVPVVDQPVRPIVPDEATKLAGATGSKGSADPKVAEELLEKIDQIAEIFWETKK